MLADSHIAAPQPSPTAPIHFEGATPHLDIRAEPDAEQLAAVASIGLLRGECRVVDLLERLVHRRLVVAGIDVDLGAAGCRVQTRRVLVGELVGLDEVLPSDLRAVHADLSREQVHGPLDDVGRLGSAGAAVRVDEVVFV